MEAQTDLQTYLEQGRSALAQGQGREAAIAYAHSAQIEPNNPAVHLGLAEANLALGNYGVVQMAAHKVQELQPGGGNESRIAQALLDLLDRRYERALQSVDAVVQEDPGNAYVHALRSYLLRAIGQAYDANLARARASRLSYGGRFENAFPALDPQQIKAAQPEPLPVQQQQVEPSNRHIQKERNERIDTASWSRPNSTRRSVLRISFFMSQHPGLITNILISINVIAYLLLALAAHSFDIDAITATIYGGQNTLFIKETGDYWRIFTAMFVHFNLAHIGLNMLSLFFMGRVVEVVYGWWRYLIIYLGSGIVGGIVTFFLLPVNTVSAGASGAIFGVFGALGIFYLVNRRALGGYGGGGIANWLFWLVLNLAWGFTTPGIGIVDHIGGLIGGMVLSLLLIPKLGRR